MSVIAYNLTVPNIPCHSLSWDMMPGRAIVNYISQMLSSRLPVSFVQ